MGYTRISLLPTPHTGLWAGPPNQVGRWSPQALDLWVLNLFQYQQLYSTRRKPQIKLTNDLCCCDMSSLLSTLPALFHLLFIQPCVASTSVTPISQTRKPRQHINLAMIAPLESSKSRIENQIHVDNPCF